MADLRTQLFRTWFRLSRPMTLGVRAIVENADGEILLVRHTYTEGLHFPGGGVEHAETVYESMVRELEEEGGVRVTGEAGLIGVFSNHRHMRNDHVLLYQINAEAWVPCGDPIGREISEIVWCDPAKPPADTTAGTQRRLTEMITGSSAAAHW